MKEKILPGAPGAASGLAAHYRAASIDPDGRNSAQFRFQLTMADHRSVRARPLVSLPGAAGVNNAEALIAARFNFSGTSE